MPTEYSHDVSALEQELELYLGREYLSGHTLDILARNTDGAQVVVTFNVDEGQASAVITVSGYTVEKTGETVGPSTIQLRSLTRNASGTAVRGVGAAEGYDAVQLTLEVKASAQVFVVTGKPIKLGVVSPLGKSRSYLILEPAAEQTQKLLRYIGSLALPVNPELELNPHDDELQDESDEDGVGELESELESAFSGGAEIQRADLKSSSADDSREVEHFWPFTSEPDEDTLKQQLRDFLTNADTQTRRAYVEALDQQLESWVRKSAPWEIAKLAFLRARQFTALALARIQSPTNVARDVEAAFDVLGVVKGVAVAGAAVDVILTLTLPLGPIDAILALGVTAARVGRALTAVARIKKQLESVEKILKAADGLQDAKQIADRVQEARTELGTIEDLALQERARSRELAEPGAEELESDLGAEEASEELEAQELDGLEDPAVEERFADELLELTEREFESAAELDEELDRGLDAVAEEYFVKRLRRKRRRGKGQGVFGKILKAGAKLGGKLASATPVGSLIKAGTSLIQGDAKGALKNLAKAAVGTALGPVAGTVATTALDALGGEEGEIRHRQRRAVRRVARIARDTFRELADGLPEDFEHPLVANEVVHRATRRAMLRNGVRLPSRRPVPSPRPLAGRRPRAVQRRVIRVRPDEEVLLVGGA